MATVIRNITVTIDGVPAQKFKCIIEGEEYYVSDIELKQTQGEPNILQFNITPTGFLETLSQADFSSCAAATGKMIELTASSESSILFSVFQRTNPNLDGTISFKGIITSMEAERSSRSSYIHVTAKSFDYLLTLGVNCRSFDGLTLKEIAEQIIDNYQGDIVAEINPAFTEVLPYTVQFQESDYDFLKRLATTYGEWIYSDGVKLIFGAIEDKEQVSLSYIRGEMENYKVDVKPVNLSQEFIAKDYRYGSYNVQSSSQETEEAVDADAHPLLSRIKQNSEGMLHKVKDNIVRTSLGGNYDSVFDELRQKLPGIIEAGRKLSEAVKYSGSTFCTKLNIGTRLDVENSMISNILQGKATELSPDELYVIEATHYLNCEGGYANDFVGKPIASAKAPGYSFKGAEKASACTAKVVDNEDPEKLGRIRVQFDWQETYDGEMYTPWLRIIHPYGGKHKGFSFVPEIGEEVMVDFVGGNPEKPFVLGTIFSGIEEPDDAWLPGDNQVKAIRTRNGHTIEIWDEGEGGYIRIYDNEKENYILTFSTDEKLIKLESTGNIELYAQNDIIMHAGHDINASAGHDISTKAENDRIEIVGRNIQTAVKADRFVQLGGKDELIVACNQFVRIGDNKDERIQNTFQHKAKDIRIEAEDKLLEYSATHHQSASNSMRIDATTEVEIKGGVIREN